MKALKKSLLTSVCLLLTPPVFASVPATIPTSGAQPGSVVASMTVIDRYALRCRGNAPERTGKIQGTELWGTKRTWDAEQQTDERHSVLTFIDGEAVRKAPAGVKAVRLEEGRLKTWPDASSDVVGMVLQGADSEGNAVEVAICDAEPSADDPSVEWYRVEAWNPVAQEWENPCQARGRLTVPRAMAVGGVWDTQGAHQDAPGKVTLACELGAISKCITWGYQPWSERDGKSLAGMHQACTRMARADYCGNGRSHTLNGTVIDLYDSFGIQTRMTKATSAWDPALASFEAAWGPEGAACLARTRYGEPLEAIIQECPGRFRKGATVDLGDDDRCTVQREGMSPETVLLRNRSYDGR